MSTDQTCINCGQPLTKKNGVRLCVRCNSETIDSSQIFIESSDEDDWVFIECHGATLYEEGTNDIKAGVKFNDDDDITKGHQIIEHPVYAPAHNKRRRVKREALGNIRRCQACQDYTVRMRRPEGADFYIPSNKHPNRKKLKSVNYRTYA